MRSRAAQVLDVLPDRDDLEAWRERLPALRAPSVSAPSISAVDLARGLGVFSIALGLAELLAGKAVSRTAGIPAQRTLTRFFGLREIATGVAILANPRSPALLWARVAGDALDLAVLATGANRANPRRSNVGISLATVAAVTILDIAVARRLRDER